MITVQLFFYLEYDIKYNWFKELRKRTSAAWFWFVHCVDHYSHSTISRIIVKNKHPIHLYKSHWKVMCHFMQINFLHLKSYFKNHYSCQMCFNVEIHKNSKLKWKNSQFEKYIHFFESNSRRLSFMLITASAVEFYTEWIFLQH